MDCSSVFSGVPVRGSSVYSGRNITRPAVVGSLCTSDVEEANVAALRPERLVLQNKKAIITIIIVLLISLKNINPDKDERPASIKRVVMADGVVLGSKECETRGYLGPIPNGPFPCINNNNKKNTECAKPNARPVSPRGEGPSGRG